MTTIGVKVNKKSVFLEGREVALLLWDIAGEITQDKVPTSYFLGASGVIYVFDLSRPLTYQNISTDLAYLRSVLPYAVIRVVGNKSDLLDADQLAKLEMGYDVLTSAKTGENVESLFTQLAADML